MRACVRACVRMHVFCNVCVSVYKWMRNNFTHLRNFFYSIYSWSFTPIAHFKQNQKKNMHSIFMYCNMNIHTKIYFSTWAVLRFGLVFLLRITMAILLFDEFLNYEANALQSTTTAKDLSDIKSALIFFPSL